MFALATVIKALVTLGVVVLAVWLWWRRQRRETRALEQLLGAPIADEWKTPRALQQALAASKLCRAEMVIGVDFSESNASAQSYEGRCLHDGSQPPNPYQLTLFMVGKSLKAFDSDGVIPVFGMAGVQRSYDEETEDDGVCDGAKGEAAAEALPELWPLSGVEASAEAQGFEQVLAWYTDAVKRRVCVGGECDIMPLVDRTIELVQQTPNVLHLLVIVTTGDFSAAAMHRCRAAVAKASHHPISIIVFGLGDGPFDDLKALDDDMEGREFDNLQFVDCMSVIRNSAKLPDQDLALNALMEVPRQYECMLRLGYIE